MTGGCQERSGFLFSHECDQPAQWPCALCGKMICGLHTRMLDQGAACIACAQTQTAAARREEKTGENRDTDDPFFWSTSSTTTWDDDDHDAFESSQGSVPGGEWEADSGGS